MGIAEGEAGMVIAPLGAAAAVTSREGFDIFREGAEKTIQSPNKLSGIMGTFDKATGELSVEMVEVAEKGIGVGRELYARLLREIGFSDVTNITGRMGFDNAKVLKAGGSFGDTPRAKILDPLTFGNHTYDEASGIATSTR